MGLVTESFNGNGVLKDFTVSNDILSKSHCRVHYYYDSVDHEIFEDDWDLLGKSTIVFDEPPTNGYIVKITTSSDGTGLGSSPSEISEVAANIDDVIIVAGLSSELQTLAPISADITTVATNNANVTIVADNDANVTIVALNDTNITAVASNSTNINAVATKEADITTVATNIVDVGIVATDILDVETVATDIADVITVATDLGGTDTIGTVATNIANVNSVGTDIINVNTVAGELADINTVATDIADVSTVAGDMANVTAVGDSIADVTTVATDLTGSDTIGIVANDIANVNIVGQYYLNMNTVAGDIDNVNTVATDIADVSTVATSMGNVNVVAGSITNVNTVGTSITNVNTVAGMDSDITTVISMDADITAVVSDATDIGIVAGDIANVNVVGGDIASVNSCANNLADIMNYADTYLGSKASDPSTRNDASPLEEGDIYWNSTTKFMKNYNGSIWVTTYVDVGGALIDSNNLSDVSSVSSARTNLDVYSKAESDALGATVHTFGGMQASMDWVRVADISTPVDGDSITVSLSINSIYGIFKVNYMQAKDSGTTYSQLETISGGESVPVMFVSAWDNATPDDKSIYMLGFMSNTEVEATENSPTNDQGTGTITYVNVDTNSTTLAKDETDEPISYALGKYLDYENNLAELDSPSDARTNLDVYSKTEAMPKAGGAYTGLVEYDDTVFTTNIDCSLGNSFSKTSSGAFSQTFSNLPTSGNACVLVIVLTNGGAGTITWDSSVKWAGGAEPSWSAAGIDTVSMYTIDGGTNWLCNATIGYA